MFGCTAKAGSQGFFASLVCRRTLSPKSVLPLGTPSVPEDKRTNIEREKPYGHLAVHIAHNSLTGVLDPAVQLAERRGLVKQKSA